MHIFHQEINSEILSDILGSIQVDWGKTKRATNYK